MTTFRNRRQVEHQILWQISKTQIKIYVMPMLKVRLIQSDLTSISAISFRRLRELHSQNLESSSSRNAKHSDGVRDMERDLAGYYNKSCKRQRAKMQSWALEKPLSSKYKGMQQFLTPKDIITNSGQPAADAIGQDYSGIDVSTDAGLMAWQRNAITKCIGSHQTAPQPRGKEVDALVESSKRNEALNVPEVAVDNTNKVICTALCNECTDADHSHSLPQMIPSAPLIEEPSKRLPLVSMGVKVHPLTHA